MNAGSIMYGGAVPAWLEKRTGRRTVWKPCAAISAKSPGAIGRPHSPSLGASRWLPMLRHAPMRVLAWVSTGVAEGIGVGAGVGAGVTEPPEGAAELPPPHE